MTWPPELSVRDEQLRAALGLTPKRDGWYKSIDGRTRYLFKRMPLRDAARLIEPRIAQIRSGVSIVRVASVLTIERLAEMFIESMRQRMETGIPKRLARRTFDDYVNVLSRFVDHVGPDRPAEVIGPTNFTSFVRTLAGRSISTLRREMQYVDRLFNWAGPGKRSMNLIPFAQRGPDWIKPSDDQISQAGADADKSYLPWEVRVAFDAIADNPMLLAAAHLGLNCGFIPKDCATLPDNIVDLNGAAIRFPRGKTGVGRVCPLLPQTIDACRAWLVHRDRIKRCDPSAAGLFFRTRQGFPLGRTLIDDDGIGTDHNALTKTWSRRVGLPFTGLRSTFATLADDWPDQRAIDVVLGHKVGRVSGHVRARHYAKRFNPERARELVEQVWWRAFGEGAAESPATYSPSAKLRLLPDVPTVAVLA